MGKTGAKELYGLIGHPVKHSYSAFMHNAAFAYLGMNAEYRLFEVAPEGLDEFFKKTIAEKRIRGFNVTVPHKEKAVAYLNGEIEAAVVMNQAVNTVRVEPDGRLSGFNTDGAGFAGDLKERGIGVSGKRISLIGAGGGARAVATAAASLGPASLLIFDSDGSRSLKLVDILKRAYPSVAAEAVDTAQGLKVGEADILVNATPVGMKESDPLLVKKEGLHPGLFVYDLIYNPAETKLLKTAKEAGCRTANGAGMLLYQGVLAFQRWTGQEVPVDVMRKALSERMSRGCGTS